MAGPYLVTTPVCVDSLEGYFRRLQQPREESSLQGKEAIAAPLTLPQTVYFISSLKGYFRRLQEPREETPLQEGEAVAALTLRQTVDFIIEIVTAVETLHQVRSIEGGGGYSTHLDLTSPF